MATYFMNEMAIDLPELGFVDRSIHDLDAALPSGDVVGLLVVRHTLRPEESLREAVREHRVREATRLAGYTVLGDAETTAGGAPAVVLSTRWHNGHVAFYTREAHVARSGTWLIFAATTVLGAREGCDAYLDHLLSTLRFRDSD
jgi:hypothetical protein